MRWGASLGEAHHCDRSLRTITALTFPALRRPQPRSSAARWVEQLRSSRSRVDSPHVRLGAASHLNCTEWARGERLSHSRPCRAGLPDRAPRQAMGRTTAGGRRELAPLRGGTSSVTGNGLGIRVASDTEARAAPDTCFPTAAARTVVGRLRFRTRTLGPGAREASRPRRANQCERLVRRGGLRLVSPGPGRWVRTFKPHRLGAALEVSAMAAHRPMPTARLP